MSWRVAVGFLAGLVVVGACSDTPAATTTATTAAPPPIQIRIPKFEATWEPADDVEQVTTLTSAELARLGGSALVPISLTSEADRSSGRLIISRKVPPVEVRVDVYITFTRDGIESSVSLSSYEADQGHPTCAERMAGGSGWEDGKSAEVRSVPGCMFTNTAGLSFVEWDDGDRWYHVETWMQPDDAISWLADWKQLP